MAQVLVTGLGVTGAATARSLAKLGYEVIVFEERDDQSHRELAEKLEKFNIQVKYEAPKTFPPLVITSPGWRPDHPILVAAIAHGAQIRSEIEFAFRHDQEEFHARKSEKRFWIGVTGTNEIGRAHV